MRVVSLACSNTEIVDALGCGDLLVGVDDHSDHPAALLAPLPRLGPDLDPDLDRLAALEPDLVLATLTVPGHERVVEAIRARGLPFVAPEPVSLEDVYRDVADIARLLGVPERGDRLVASMRAELDAPPPAPDAPTLLVEWWPKPVIAPGRLSWTTDVLHAAGARGPIEGEEVKSRPLADEEVRALAPDAFVLSWCGVHPDKYRPDVIYRNPVWAELPALREGRVFCVPEACWDDRDRVWWRACGRCGAWWLPSPGRSADPSHETLAVRPRAAYSYERMNPKRVDTRASLLAAARRQFARRGYDGASIRAITRAAHANLGSVTYHFGSKHALYDAVLDQVLSPLAHRIAAAVEGGGDALDRAEATVRAFFDHLAENPDMPQLMLQEIAAGKTPPAPVARTLGMVSGRLAQLVREGQSAGDIRAGDPLLLALSLVYQPVHLTLVQRMGKHLVGLDQGNPRTRARVVEHAAAFARAGLAAAREDRS